MGHAKGLQARKKISERVIAPSLKSNIFKWHRMLVGECEGEGQKKKESRCIKREPSAISLFLPGRALEG